MGCAFSAKPCDLIPLRDDFDANGKVYESVLLTFKGVGKKNVYNCSVPFTVKGKRYLFGRVEEAEDWAIANVVLFEEIEKDVWEKNNDSMTFNLEDPFIVKIHNEMVFGGTRVVKNASKVCSYRCDFYRGTPFDQKHVSSGPDKMKDVRLIELANGEIGVFSHFRQHNECLTGFTTIKRIEMLSQEIISSAPFIDHRVFGDAWGGPNQCYLLSSGLIGCVGHHGYLQNRPNACQLRVYCITSFVFDPKTYETFDFKVIGTRKSFPEGKPKIPCLEDCAFASGIVMRDDGKVDLFSGVGDVSQGRCVIDYPFEGRGEIVSSLDFDDIPSGSTFF